MDIPGTACFDLELDHLSAYFVALDETDQVVGDVGAAEFSGLPECAESSRSCIWMTPQRGRAMAEN